MHHAYLYEGNLTILPKLASHARKLIGVETRGKDPDVHMMQFEKFGIDDARSLRVTASLRSVTGHVIFIIGAAAMTTEAQQALLKLFEEPQEGTVFVLLVPKGSILPTLRSRFMEYPAKLDSDASATEVKKFMAAPYKTRSAEITKLLKDEEGVRERARDFLDALEEFLYNQFWGSKEQEEIKEGLEDIARVRSYVGDRSPSLKMLLEHLAATLPQLK